MQDFLPAEISVIIVNYGTAALCVKAVESVKAYHHGGRQVDIHVVDNASPGDDASVLSRAHAVSGWGNSVTLYLEDENHGFGRGNNLVLEKLALRPEPPHKVFLLNPDAQLDNDALEILATFIDAHPDVGCAGAAIMNPGGQHATAAFRFPSTASEFSDSLAFGPVARFFARHMVALPADLPTQPVHWVSGAAVMFRWEALKQSQGFDPDFFLYFEEVDLMRRLSSLGWETWYVPDAKVHHIEGAATNVKSSVATRSARPDYWYDSWLIYHLKSHGRWGALLCAIARLGGWTGNLIVSSLRRRPTLAPKHYINAFTRRVLRPLAGLSARDSS